MSRRPRASTRDRAGKRARAVLRPREKVRETRAARAREVSVVASIEPRRRRRGVLALKVGVGLALIATTFVVGGKWLVHQSIFRVQHVTLIGEVHETSQEILSTTRLDAHPAMIDLSQAALQQDLSVYPWIGSISLIKRWPNSVDLSIHELSSVAVAFDPHHVLRYVSADGRDLGTAPTATNMPTLVTTPVSLAARSWPYQGAESAAALVASQLPVAFNAQVSQIIVDARGNVTLQLTMPLKFYLGPATDLNAKFVAVASAIDHGTFVAGDLVDVTTPSELSVTGPSPS